MIDPDRHMATSLRTCQAKIFVLQAVALLFLTAIAASAADEPAKGINLDKDKRTITIDAKVAPRKIYEKPYFIEVIACWPHPKGKKAHETVVTFDVKPSDVHKAMETLGLKPGTPVMGESKEPPQGPEVHLFLEIPGADGQPRRVPVEQALLDPKTEKPMPKVKWRFTGSAMVKPDPDKPEKVYGADRSGTLISIFPVTNETVFQTNLTMKEEKYLKLETNKKVLPKEGAPVKLVIVVPAQ